MMHAPYELVTRETENRTKWARNRAQQKTRRRRSLRFKQPWLSGRGERFIHPTWKSAEVTAIPKIPCSQSLQTDLRPISLLPTVAKVFESFISRRLQLFLEPTFDEKQFRCRPKRSTTHALIAITHNVYE